MPNRRAKASQAARIGRVDVVKRVERLARSVAEIEVALRGAEREIEAGARERIQMLRDEASEQLAVLRGHQLEATRLLRRLSAAAGVVGRSRAACRRALAEARVVADSMLERLRGAVPG